MSDVSLLLLKCTQLLQKPEPWKNAKEIIPMRKALVLAARDTSLSDHERYDLMFAAEACKTAVNHVPLKERLKGYPESKLYGHESLTAKCGSMTVELARRFEFAPSPMALGIKRYFTVLL